MAKFSFIDLFSGIGGFRLGLQRNGGECIGFSEINKDAIDFYCENFGDDRSENLGNITKIENLPQHDLLTAGVPCQSWSIAGKNLGFEDDRGQLWNDTIYLLNKSRPKAFIFENVKGIQDPRNRDAFKYILNRIKEAGYFAKWFLINSHDYGLPQNRIRVYIIGFKDKRYLDSFKLPDKPLNGHKLFQHLEDLPKPQFKKKKINPTILFGKNVPFSRTKFQKKDELNDFFLFNDIRNGHSTIHSWDLKETTEREKEICYLLLTNRRKKKYGPFDGNPLSLEHFKEIDSSISKLEIDELCTKTIFKEVDYVYEINNIETNVFTGEEFLILEHSIGNRLHIKDLKNSPELKKNKIKFSRVLKKLIQKKCLSPIEIRYDFKNSKISSGIDGINRIYLPNSEVFSTLVASDTNDFIATENIFASDPEEFKSLFLNKIVKQKKFRKIKKTEALVIQGFDDEFNLPNERSRWMKLIGNSVSVPVIDYLAKSIVETGVFED
ncbi:DNA cytosine methyltransferase [Maribacter sp. HTCC2170]|uniref:DNA cytosine methyltransferase n=1 Tax=Maribacter sp. (strain HTCC2170 / KCCM 42371) TaxID=313603 RepID=UPI00006BD5A5|nr:DNA (cytosine-5-)-methyltransferase [Maribacter sp. HTCC2170]EAR03030.1 putative DNA modification methylase (N.MgoV) [Maribacter sp. HTCC2170]